MTRATLVALTVFLLTPLVNAGSGGPQARARAAWDSIPKTMISKGLLPSDLDDELQAQLLVVVKAMGAKQWAAVPDATAVFLASIERIVINHAFVQAKMSRINREYRKLEIRLSKDETTRLKGLLDHVSDAFIDGYYAKANERINVVHDLLAQAKRRAEKEVATDDGSTANESE